MNSPTPPSSAPKDRFIEVVELLLEQYVSAESRRESADRQQLEMLDQIQSQLQRLAGRLESLTTDRFVRESLEQDASGEPSADAEHVSPSHEASPASAEAFSEWERQKRELLTDLQKEATEKPNKAADRPEVSPSAPCCESELAEEGLASVAEEEGTDSNEATQSVLSRLQQQEVEMARERAALARERTEFEARMAEWECDRRKADQQASDATRGNGKKKDAGRADRLLRFLGRSAD